MRILYTVDKPEKDASPYVRTIMHEVHAHAPQWHLDAGIELFWSDECLAYDVVHVMFPHFLVGQHGAGNGRKTSQDLERRLGLLRSKGVQIVATCHNLAPHYNADPEAKSAYDVVYRNSAMIFHLGSYSMKEGKRLYPEAKHLLLEHPVYDREYPFIPSREEARRKLMLDPSCRYLLCFGAFRDDEERNLVGKVADAFRGQKLRILAPSFFRIRNPHRRNKIIVLSQLCKKEFLRLRFPNVINEGRLVPNDLVPYYLRACDEALIQRVRILNSGNLPLNYYFGNVVVGPSVGNVGQLLSETGNPSFDPRNDGSLISAVCRGLELSQSGKGEENRKYAMDHWTTEAVGARQFAYYLELQKQSGLDQARR